MLAFKWTPWWGTFPEWLAAIGTLLAFAVALRLLFKELEARREAQEDRRRNQARLVAAWITSKWASETELRFTLVVRNGSDEPIYDGRCVVVPSTNRIASDPMMVFDWEFRWLVLPPQETKEDDLRLPEKLWRSLWDAGTTLSFTDAAGRRWTRYPDGRLVPSDRPRRRSRKDYMNAWIAGELDQLDY
jgi:hypothetical protein